MATLEKIRQRKKILAIVIGAALLAFIIEVGIEAIGRSGGNSAAAKVGNEKIDIMAFQRRVEQEAAKDQENSQQTDAALRQQRVLDEMINEKLLEQEYEKLGIYVSDNEISQLMIGKNPAPAVMQFAQQYGANSPAEFYDFIMNPGKQGVQEAQVAELRAKWEELKQDLTKQYMFAKLQNLMAGCMQANDLDRAQMAEDEAMTNVVTYAKKEYSTVPDDKYPVTDEELKAEWQKLKPMFKTDEDIRVIHYIAVNIDPSQEDIAAANKLADAAYIALQKGRGVDSVRILGTVQIDTAKTVQKEMPAKVRDFFAGAEVGTTRRDSTVNNHYAMYKLINKEMSLDSVELSYVVVQADAKTQQAVLAQFGERPMKIHIFNPEHDLALASNLDNFTAPHAGRDLRHDLGFLPAIWAGRGERVLVDNREAAEYAYSKLGLPMRGVFITRHEFWNLGQSPLMTVEPWGWDRAIRKELLRYRGRADRLPDDTYLNIVRQSSHRSWAAEHLLRLLRQLPGTVGEAETAHSLAEIRRFLSVRHRIVLKAPWSSSGRGVRYISDDPDSTSTLTPQLEGWVEHILRRQGAILMEPYYNKVMDFGMEWESDGQGDIRYCGLSLFNTVKGAYTGNILADEEEKEQRVTQFISPVLLSDVRQRIKELLTVSLVKFYHGPFGIDMMVVSQDGKLFLHPCVELNLRMTMGHVALRLREVATKPWNTMRVNYKNGKYCLEMK